MNAMREQGMEVICAVPKGDDLILLENLGYSVITYDLDRKGINPIHDLSTVVELKRIFLVQKPDILFATTIKPVIYGCLAAHWARVPQIFATITGLGYAFEADTPFKKLINRATTLLYRYSLKYATGIFFQNQDDARLFRQCDILGPGAKVFFARGTGVDTSYFAQAPLPCVTEDSPITFLLVGRLLAAKGIYEYAQAAKELKKTFPTARFQLLGLPESGRGSISLEQVKALEPAIEYLGHASDVRPYLAKAHIAVLPSWREGTPTALMEAMSMGRPLVATDVPGCREVVRNGFNGFLAVCQNPESLALAMRHFLDQPELIASMGRKSRELATSEFEARTVANGILKNMAGSQL